jgi:hypothetical protein
LDLLPLCLDLLLLCRLFFFFSILRLPFPPTTTPR